MLNDKASAKMPRVKYGYPMYADDSPQSGHLHYSKLMRARKLQVLVSYNPSFHRRVVQLGSFGPLSNILVARRRCSRMKNLSSLHPFYHFHSIPICTRRCATRHLHRHVPCYFTRRLCPKIPHVALRRVIPSSPFVVNGPRKGGMRIAPLQMVRNGLPVLKCHVNQVT